MSGILEVCITTFLHIQVKAERLQIHQFKANPSQQAAQFVDFAGVSAGEE
jgi:hypothetical protein